MLVPPFTQASRTSGLSGLPLVFKPKEQKAQSLVCKGSFGTFEWKVDLMELFHSNRFFDGEFLLLIIISKQFVMNMLKTSRKRSIWISVSMHQLGAHLLFLRVISWFFLHVFVVVLVFTVLSALSFPVSNEKVFFYVVMFFMVLSWMRLALTRHKEILKSTSTSNIYTCYEMRCD